MDMRRMVTLATALCLLTAGCASTVQTRSTAMMQGLGTSASGAESSSARAPGDALTVPASSAAARAAPGAGSDEVPVGIVSSPSRITASAPAPSGGPQSILDLTNGPGVTASTISVGVAIPDDVNGGNAAIGAGAVTHGDETTEYRVKVADINKRGGIAGRTVRLVEFHYSATGSETMEQIEQRACAYFTQDHKVAMVVNVALSDTGLQCLTSKGVAVYGGSLSYSTDQVFARFPRFVEPIALGLSRQAPNYANGLEAMGYFTGGSPAKVGLVTYDEARFARATSQLKAALARNGHAIEDVVAVDGSSVQAAAPDISSAVLRFQADGIDHVLFLDPSGVAELLFLNQAESQRYRPRYGFGGSAGGALRAAGEPAAQFVRSVTIGWHPRLDGVPADRTTYPAAEGACLRLFTSHGVAFDSDNAKRHADDICDILDVADAAVSSVDGAITADSIIAATKRLSARAGSGTYRLSMTHGRTDGVDALRYSVYDQPCDCFRYVGPVRQAELAGGGEAAVRVERASRSPEGETRLT